MLYRRKYRRPRNLGESQLPARLQMSNPIIKIDAHYVCLNGAKKPDVDAAAIARRATHATVLPHLQSGHGARQKTTRSHGVTMHFTPRSRGHGAI